MIYQCWLRAEILKSSAGLRGKIIGATSSQAQCHDQHDAHKWQGRCDPCSRAREALPREVGIFPLGPRFWTESLISVIANTQPVSPIILQNLAIPQAR